jgi:uncharacterized membrane protein
MTKTIITILTIIITNSVFSQKSDSIVYCENPTVWAEFPEEKGNMGTWFWKNSQDVAKFDCFNPEAQFYYNVIVLEDGTVTKFNLECVAGQYYECIIREVDPSIIPKWKPAQNNGENCSQKLKIKTYVYFE